MNWLLSLTYQGVMEEQTEKLEMVMQILPDMSQLYSLGSRISESFPTFPTFLTDWETACVAAYRLREMRCNYQALERRVQQVIEDLKELDESLEAFTQQRYENEGMPKPYNPTSWCAWLINTACLMIVNCMFDFARQEIDAVARLYKLNVRPGAYGQYPKFPARRFPTFPLLDHAEIALLQLRRPGQS